MAMDVKQTGERKTGVGHAIGGVVTDLDTQRLRILHCTARFMAGSPGGLRFKAGTRPWLEGLPVGPRLPANAVD